MRNTEYITTSEKEARTGNTGLAKVVVQCSADSFVVNETLVFEIKFCSKNPHLRQAAKSYVQYQNAKMP